MPAHPNSGLSFARQISAGVCARIEIIATAAKIPAMTATAMMIFLFIDIPFLLSSPYAFSLGLPRNVSAITLCPPVPETFYLTECPGSKTLHPGTGHRW